ncbi:twin-arginine translocation signal domain-containing protein, partial [Alcaligenes phenolicus]
MTSRPPRFESRRLFHSAQPGSARSGADVQGEMILTDSSENNTSGPPLTRAGRSRRDALKFGSIATLGAVLGGGALLGHTAPALAHSGSDGA